jgi:hypothetical protein
MRTPYVIVALLAFLLAAPVCVAQIFHVQGGASTLFGADGGSVDIKAPGYDAQIGGGFLDGHFQYGFLVRKQFLGDILSMGDDTMKVELPTDVFDASHYFLVRGVGMHHQLADKRGSWTAFAGTTSLGFSSPFFMAARSSSGLGAIYYDHKIGSQLRVVSRNLLSSRQTSIQGLEWSVVQGMKVSASAGVGSNQPYLAGAVQIDWENLALRAAYITQGDKFQRMQIASPISTEPDKENISAMYRIRRNLTLRGTHQNIIEPAAGHEPMLRAAVDEAYTDFSVAKFNVGAGVINSRLAGNGNVGINTYAMRAIRRSVSINGNFYQSRPKDGQPSNTLTAMLREQLNQKFALTQTVINSNGQTTAGLGGEFVGNRLNATVGYQSVYVPFRPDNAFQQALSFNARINLPRNVQVTAGSFVDPRGTLRYTVGIGTYVYRIAGMSGPAGSAESFRFQKFVVEGIVVNTSGEPLEGAAIHIGTKIAYSDSDGRFMVRMDKGTACTVQVALDEFIAAGNWEVVNAPASATAQTEDEVTPIRIVLRRVPVVKKT